MAYTEPTAADLKMRYPAFASVEDAVIAWWLAYVIGKDVDQGWGDANGPEAQMSAAAGRMVKAGVKPADSEITAIAATGVTDFKSGTFQARFSDDAVKQAISNDWRDTPYGADYALALRREKSGGGVTAPGCAPCYDGFNGYAGPLPPYGIYS